MTQLIIRNGRVIDPASNLDSISDVYISDGKIASVGNEPGNFSATEEIDASNHLVIPGVIDLSARLREPGLEYKADITSETTAACASGITTLCMPPDTDPVIDEPAVVELIHRKTKLTGQANVVALGALTARLKGAHLSEVAALKEAGCVGLSNAGKPVQSTLILSRALEYATSRDITIFIEPDDHSLSANGCAHDGPIATRLGLPSIPVAAETSAIAQILELIVDIPVKIHFSHISAGRSVDLIKQGKEAGLPVTCDVAIHHLHLTEMDISSFNSQCHVIPPLRSQRDLDALMQGVKDNVIDAICSDHQPHDIDAKLAPYPSTEPGISGLDTLLPLALKLVESTCISEQQILSKLTSGPAEILNLNKGQVANGKDADITIIDPDLDWLLDSNTMLSRGKNTPFHGWQFRHKAKCTLVNGKIVFNKL